MRRGILITVLAALLAVVIVMMRSVSTEQPLAGNAPALEPGSAIAEVKPTRQAIELAPVEALPPQPEPEPEQTRPERPDGGRGGDPTTSADEQDDSGDGAELGRPTPFVVSGRVTAVDGTPTNRPPQNISLGPGPYALLATTGELVAVSGGIQLTENNPSARGG